MEVDKVKIFSEAGESPTTVGDFRLLPTLDKLKSQNCNNTVPVLNLKSASHKSELEDTCNVDPKCII